MQKRAAVRRTATEKKKKAKQTKKETVEHTSVAELMPADAAVLAPLQSSVSTPRSSDDDTADVVKHDGYENYVEEYIAAVDAQIAEMNAAMYDTHEPEASFPTAGAVKEERLTCDSTADAAKEEELTCDSTADAVKEEMPTCDSTADAVKEDRPTCDSTADTAKEEKPTCYSTADAAKDEKPTCDSMADAANEEFDWEAWDSWDFDVWDLKPDKFVLYAERQAAQLQAELQPVIAETWAANDDDTEQAWTAAQWSEYEEWLSGGACGASSSSTALPPPPPPPPRPRPTRPPPPTDAAVRRAQKTLADARNKTVGKSLKQYQNEKRMRKRARETWEAEHPGCPFPPDFMARDAKHPHEHHVQWDKKTFKYVAVRR